MTLLDPTLGEIIFYENYGKINDKTIILDEVNQILTTYNILELIISSNDVGVLKLEIPTINIDFKSIPISYQEELIKHSFGIDTSHLSAIETVDMEKFPFALNSLTNLLDFVIEHNKLLGVSLHHPRQIYSHKYMYLGNNPISQLDIYNKDTIDLLNIVNKGISSIGRRYIKEQLLNPLKDKTEIENRLVLSSEFINYDKRADIEGYLRGIYDIERILRKIEIGTIQPFEFANLYNSLNLVKNIEVIQELEDIPFYSFLNSLEEKFDFDIMVMSNFTNFTETFIK